MLAASVSCTPAPTFCTRLLPISTVAPGFTAKLFVTVVLAAVRFVALTLDDVRLPIFAFPAFRLDVLILLALRLPAVKFAALKLVASDWQRERAVPKAPPSFMGPGAAVATEVIEGAEGSAGLAESADVITGLKNTSSAKAGGSGPRSPF